MDNIKILHQWEVSLEKEVDETITETMDGQEVKITRKVKKPIVYKLALKQPTRRELRAAELFYATEYSKFLTMGLLPRSIIIDKHMDLSGGVLGENEKDHISKLNIQYRE